MATGQKWGEGTAPDDKENLRNTHTKQFLIEEGKKNMRNNKIEFSKQQNREIWNSILILSAQTYWDTISKAKYKHFPLRMIDDSLTQPMLSFANISCRVSPFSSRSAANLHFFLALFFCPVLKFPYDAFAHCMSRVIIIARNCQSLRLFNVLI